MPFTYSKSFDSHNNMVTGMIFFLIYRYGNGVIERLGIFFRFTELAETGRSGIYFK